MDVKAARAGATEHAVAAVAMAVVETEDRAVVDAMADAVMVRVQANETIRKTIRETTNETVSDRSVSTRREIQMPQRPRMDRHRWAQDRDRRRADLVDMKIVTKVVDLVRARRAKDADEIAIAMLVRRVQGLDRGVVMKGVDPKRKASVTRVLVASEVTVVVIARRFRRRIQCPRRTMALAKKLRASLSA